MFKEYQGKVSIKQIEEEILTFWDKNRIFEKSLEIRENHPNFVFYEGPPTANGRPGIHHVMSRTIKDAVCRYKTMAGYYVYRKAGWDTHGLPVEIEVEKMLGIEGKDEIEKYGVDKFNEKCKESVFKYKKEWDELTRRIGYWLDLEHPYITFQNEYIESVWWILKTYFDRGLIYQGFKILPYCPRCETPLSSHEVSLGYKDVKDPSIYIKVRLKSEPNTFFLVWTTTPWTLISNVALAVHPYLEYVKVKVLSRNEYYILARDRLSAVLDEEYEIVDTFRGSEMEGWEYERLFDFLPVEKKAFYVVTGDFVSAEDGTGIVHIAPAFGDDDYQIGQKYDLPLLRPVDKNGRFEDAVVDYKGMFVKEADPLIIENLKKRNLLFKKETIEHSYPHCWRCDSPLLYYARESWYIRTSQFKDNMLKNNEQINWHPPEVGSGRFGEWLKNNIDWAISRDRYWGTPLNIWTCQNCDHQIAIESIKELREKGKDVPEDIDLHKPYVDAIEIPCEKCGGSMKRTPEVIDVWFDSGSMPYAQWHYPFENQDKFKQNFPADFICEGIDQTRGWFYSLLAISTLLFDQPAFKNIVVNELILDKEGQKMSKSRGNVVHPEDVINQFGADPLRWYFITVSVPWVPKRFDIKGVEEVYRKFFDTLMNTYNFFALYANIDRFNPEEKVVPIEERPEIDRWILSLLYTTVDKVSNLLDDYDVTRAARLIGEFLLDDVSNWYVRRNRRRFWKSERGPDKSAAYQTLYEVLLTVAKLIAPFAPFVAEEIYQNLKTPNMPESVHLCDYPRLSDEHRRYQNPELEETMKVAQQVVSLARAIRNEIKMKVRQPLSELIVVTPSQSTRQAVLKMANIIQEEINVKNIRVSADEKEVVSRKARPNFKSLGPKFGKLVNKVAEHIQRLPEETIDRFVTDGKVTFTLDGQEIILERDDVEIVEENRNNFATLREGNLLVALNTELTESLIQEGIAREIVNRIQNLRKENQFEVTDRITIFIEAPAEIDKAIQKMSDYIMSETLAIKILNKIPDSSLAKVVNVDGKQVKILIKKVEN